MYYLENGRVKSYILDKQITNKSIIASDKEYRVKRKVDEKYNISGKNIFSGKKTTSPFCTTKIFLFYEQECLTKIKIPTIAGLIPQGIVLSGR